MNVDWYEAQEIKERMAFGRNECSCGEPLEYFSGLEYIPEHLFCPKCMTWAYNLGGERIFQFE